MRLDRWLWMIRVYKTRTVAAHAIKAGRVEVDGRAAKPAFQLRAGEMVTVRLDRMTRTLRVVGVPTARVGAKLVSNFAEDFTPPEEFEKQRRSKPNLPNLLPPGFRVKRRGLPTKREGRNLKESRFGEPLSSGD